MKNLSTLLSVLSLIGVGILFYLHFSTGKNPEKQAVSVSPKGDGNFRIAYFDIDSLQEKYEYFKDASGQIKSKEASLTAQLNSLENSFQKTIERSYRRRALR